MINYRKNPYGSQASADFEQASLLRQAHAGTLSAEDLYAQLPPPASGESFDQYASRLGFNASDGAMGSFHTNPSEMDTISRRYGARRDNGGILAYRNAEPYKNYGDTPFFGTLANQAKLTAMDAIGMLAHPLRGVSATAGNVEDWATGSPTRQAIQEEYNNALSPRHRELNYVSTEYANSPDAYTQQYVPEEVQNWRGRQEADKFVNDAIFGALVPQSLINRVQGLYGLNRGMEVPWATKHLPQDMAYPSAHYTADALPSLPGGGYDMHLSDIARMDTPSPDVQIPKLEAFKQMGTAPKPLPDGGFKMQIDNIVHKDTPFPDVQLPKNDYRHSISTMPSTPNVTTSIPRIQHPPVAQPKVTVPKKENPLRNKRKMARSPERKDQMTYMPGYKSNKQIAAQAETKTMRSQLSETDRAKIDALLNKRRLTPPADVNGNSLNRVYGTMIDLPADYMSNKSATATARKLGVPISELRAALEALNK